MEEKKWLTVSYNCSRIVSSNVCLGSVEVPLRSLVEVLHPHLNRQGRRGGQAKLSVEDLTAGGVGVLARVQESVSHRSELGITRNHSWANCTIHWKTCWLSVVSSGYLATDNCTNLGGNGKSW